MSFLRVFTELSQIGGLSGPDLSAIKRCKALFTIEELLITLKGSGNCSRRENSAGGKGKVDFGGTAENPEVLRSYYIVTRRNLLFRKSCCFNTVKTNRRQKVFLQYRKRGSLSRKKVTKRNYRENQGNQRHFLELDKML